MSCSAVIVGFVPASAIVNVGNRFVRARKILSEILHNHLSAFYQIIGLRNRWKTETLASGGWQWLSRWSQAFGIVA